MTKEQMIKTVENHTYTPEDVSAILTAVDAYSAALISAKPNVIRSVANEVGRNCPFCGKPCAECGHKATDV